jgi:hypothetical protein
MVEFNISLRTHNLSVHKEECLLAVDSAQVSYSVPTMSAFPGFIYSTPLPLIQPLKVRIIHDGDLALGQGDYIHLVMI